MCNQTVKLQIELLLSYIVELVKSKEERGNRCLFLKYLEKQEKAITTIEANLVKEYFEKLSLQRISPQSYNNKIQAVTIFLQYLQMKDYINHFVIPDLKKENRKLVRALNKLQKET